MRRFTAILVTAAVVMVGAGSVFAQAGGKPQEKNKEAPGKADAKKTEHAQPVFFGNTQCPIDNKAISDAHDKFVEVDGQRVYVCSDGCLASVKKDTKTALAKAYPTSTELKTKACIVCGKPVDAAKGKEVVFQGKKLMLDSDTCIPVFKKQPVVYLALATFADTKDAANPVDPIDGKPVDHAVLAIYKGKIYHFSGAPSLAAFLKDPETAAAKVKS